MTPQHRHFKTALSLFIAGLLFVFVVGNPHKALARSCLSNVTSGNWSSSSSWTNCNSTTPQTTDTVEIQAGQTITINGSNRQVAGVQVDSTGVLANGGFTLTDTGTSTGVNGFTINGTLSGTGAINLSGAGVVLDGSGTVSNSGATITITAAASFAATANLTIDGAIAISGAITVTNNGTVTVNGIGGIGGTVGGSTWTQAANSTLNFGGNLSNLLATGTLNASNTGNTVNYSQNGPQTCKVVTYYHLIFSSGGTKTCNATTVNGDITLSGTVAWTTSSGLALAGNLTVGSGTTLTTSANTFTISGTTSITGTVSITSNTSSKNFVGLVTVNSGGTLSGASTQGTFKGGISSGGTVSITGTASFTTNAQALTGTMSIATVTVTGVTLTNNGTLTVSTALSGSGGLTNAATGIVNYGASAAPSINTLTATTAGNTFNYYRSGTQTCAVITYYHLQFSGTSAKTCAVTTVNGNVTISGTATWTTSANVAIGGTLTVGSGTTVTTGANFTLAVTGTTDVTGTLANTNTGVKTYTGAVTINSGGSWTNATNSNITFQGGFTNNSAGAVSFGTGTITFNTTDQSIGGTNSITIANLTVTTITLTNTGTLTVSTALAGSGGLTQGSSANLTVTGTSGITTITAGASGNTVTYNNTASAQIIKSATYRNLTISTTGQTATLGGAIIVNGNLNITAGTLDTGSGLNYAITLAGNWTNSSTFTARSGTVTLNGSSQQTLSGTLTGSSAFSALTITNNSGTDDPGCGTSFTPGVIFSTSATATTFTITTASVRVRYNSGSTYTFTNINWNGQASGTPIFFRNSNLSSGTWLLNVSGTQTAVSYVNVGRSNASSGNAIVASGTTDCNNNTNWTFGTLSIGIVDGSGGSVSSPSVVMSVLTFSFSRQTSTGTLGTSSQKIRVSNTTGYAPWTVTIAATGGATSFWDGTVADYDFNDPTANAVDGSDADSLGGRLTINPSGGTITPQSGCHTTGLSLGSSAAFSEGVTNTITLLSAGSSAEANCYWDVTGLGLSQSIPREQSADTSYTINMTVTITAS